MNGFNKVGLVIEIASVNPLKLANTRVPDLPVHNSQSEINPKTATKVKPNERLEDGAGGFIINTGVSIALRIGWIFSF